jgi:adenylate cyclase
VVRKKRTEREQPTGSARRARRHPSALIEAAYRERGFAFLRRALIAQLGLGLIVGLVGALLTVLYVDISVWALLATIAFEQVIYLTDGAFARQAIKRGLEPVARWAEKRDERAARQAWEALADLPFAPLRRRAPYVLIPTLIAVLDVGGVTAADKPASHFLLFLPGSLLVWLYWLALRFFVMEQFIRPALADVGSQLPDGGGVAQPRMTLARRLLIVVPGVTVMVGTAVAGLVGDHTLASVIAGIAASLLVALTVASWLVFLLADSVSSPVNDLRRAAERVGSGDLDVRVPVVSVDETGVLARSFNAMVEGLRERERIREAFGTYVDRDVAEHILREGTSLAGEEVEVTLLFLDIRNFTGYCEGSPATEVVATLNRLFAGVVPVIHDHGGHVDKFVGDGLLAVFGAPRRRPDHADSALAATLQIADWVESEFAGGLEVGLGLNSGAVVAGNVGGAGRMDFSVIGDAVNVAARVEAATRVTGDVILVSEATRRSLRSSRVGLEARPQVPLKGKTEAVALFAPRVGVARHALAPASGDAPARPR